MPKLTLEQEENICQEYLNTNITQQELANKYGYSKAPSINKILKKHGIRREYIHSNTKLNNIIKCNENYFETIDTSAKAYYLGFIIADGHIKKDESSLSIELSIVDEQFLLDFIKALDSEHTLYYRTKKLKSTGKTYQECTLKITRPKLCADLIKHGVGNNKSYELSISKTIPGEFMNSMIRGFIDGDGHWSIDKNNSMSFGFVGPVLSFIEEVKNILISNCNINNTPIRKSVGCYKIKWGGNLQCKRIYDYLYSDNGPFLKRKFEKSTCHFKNYFDNLSHDSKMKIETKYKSVKTNPNIRPELDKILGLNSK